MLWSRFGLEDGTYFRSQYINVLCSFNTYLHGTPFISIFWFTGELSVVTWANATMLRLSMHIKVTEWFDIFMNEMSIKGDWKWACCLCIVYGTPDAICLRAAAYIWYINILASGPCLITTYSRTSLDRGPRDFRFTSSCPRIRVNHGFDK